MAPPPILQTISIERLSDGAVLLTYNTPEKANAFTPRTYDELRGALVWAAEEEDVRVVLV